MHIVWEFVRSSALCFVKVSAWLRIFDFTARDWLLIDGKMIQQHLNRCISFTI
jgi:hypothetical protein